MEKKNCKNCSTCLNLKKNILCKKLSMRVNERDLQGEIKCKFYACIEEECEKAVGAGKKGIRR